MLTAAALAGWGQAVCPAARGTALLLACGIGVPPGISRAAACGDTLGEPSVGLQRLLQH